MEFEKINVVDSRFVNETPHVELMRGPASVSKNVSAVTGGTVNPQGPLNWNIPITTQGLALDTRWFVEYAMQITATVTPNGTAGATANFPLLAVGQNISLAPYPLNSLITNASVLINEKQVCAYDISQYRELLLRLTDTNKLNPDQLCPSLVEQSFAYYPDALFTRSDPMSSYSDSDFGAGFIPNGAYPINFSATNTSVAGNTAAAGVTGAVDVTCTINGYEPLLISPCNWNSSQENDESCPFYVRNLQINCPLYLDNSAPRCFRVRQFCAGNNLAITLTNFRLNFTKALLHYETISPPLLDGYRLPPFSVHHTYDIITNSASGSLFVANQATSQDIPLLNQTFTGMPRFIILGVMKDKNRYTVDQASFFYPIQKLVISNGNTQNILASYTFEDLFSMSRKNGLKQDYISYSGSANVIGYTNAGLIKPTTTVQTCGGPVIIDTKDLQLPFNVTNGSSGNFNMTFVATVNNNEQVTTTTVADSVVTVTTAKGYSTPILKMMAIYDEWIVTNGSTLSTEVMKSLLSPSAPLEKAPIKASNEDPQEVVGGALRKMKNQRGSATNISKGEAMAKLSKRLAY
jgi:hypothetical protein